MSAEQGLPGLDDLARLDTAFDAELLLSGVLGAAYAGAEPDRARALGSAAEHLDGRLSAAGTAPAGVARAVLAALMGDPAPDSEPPGGPGWLAALGAARATGAWAYGDRYGDQTSYLVTFAYADGSAGGPEHAVLVLVDHNLGLVCDLVVAAPAGPMLDGLRASVATDPAGMTWLAEVDPATVRAAALGYLRATDNAPELPGSAGLLDNRAVVGARLATLPSPQTAPSLEEAAEEAGPPRPGDALDGPAVRFLESPEARLAGLAEAGGARGEAVDYGLGLIVDFGLARTGDPLRWSPRAIEVFLLDWVHGRAVLDAADARVLPDALAAWVLWSGRLLGLPDGAVRATFDEVDSQRAEFARLCATGERQSPAVRAMRRLIADQVDVTDDAAVDAWLRAHEPDG